MMIPRNDSDLLSKFLFHLRTPLFSVRGASQLAKQCPEKIPTSMPIWLAKWNPAVERWISAEEKAHSFFRDSEIHNWKQIIYEMAEDMQNTSTALDEGQALAIPESPEVNLMMKLALDSGFRYLNGIVQPLLLNDYQHLLQ